MDTVTGRRSSERHEKRSDAEKEKDALLVRWSGSCSADEGATLPDKSSAASRPKLLQIGKMAPELFHYYDVFFLFFYFLSSIIPSIELNEIKCPMNLT